MKAPGGSCPPLGCGPLSLGCAHHVVEGGVSSSVWWWLLGEGCLRKASQRRWWVERQGWADAGLRGGRNAWAGRLLLWVKGEWARTNVVCGRDDKQLALLRIRERRWGWEEQQPGSLCLQMSSGPCPVLGTGDMVGLDSKGWPPYWGVWLFSSGQWGAVDVVLGMIAVRHYLYFKIMPLAAVWKSGPRGRDGGERRSHEKPTGGMMRAWASRKLSPSLAPWR